MADPLNDPLEVAGAVLWATRRQQDPDLDWQWFKANTPMREIKAFSTQMQADEEADPLVSQP